MRRDLRGLPFADGNESIVVGLPDTVWFPEKALRALPKDDLAFLLFPVDEPKHFDAVIADDSGAVREIQVKSATPDSP